MKLRAPAALVIGAWSAAILFATFRIGGWGSAQTIRVVNDLSLLAFGCFTLACAVAAFRSAEGRQRRAWGFLVAGVGGWVTGAACWAYFNVIRSLPQVPYPALGMLAFALPIAGCLALITFPVGYAGQSQWRLLLDGLIVQGSLFLIAWVLVLQQVYDNSAAPTAARNATLIAAVADMVTITVAALVVGRARTGQRFVLVLLASGLALMAVSDTFFIHVIFEREDGDARFVTAGWATGMLTLGVAAFVGGRTGQTQPGPASVPAPMSTWMPYVPLILAGGIVTLAHRESVQTPTVLSVGVAVVVAVLARQFVAVADNRRLLGVIADQAKRDPLTGLANRALFHDRLTDAVQFHRRDKRPVAVLSLDLDDFKVVNDSMGHSAGDALLKAMASRLKDCVRAGDTVARLGGDEFVVLVEGEIDDPHSVARRIVAAFDAPFEIEGHELLARPSVGLAVASLDERDISGDDLLKRADAAMYSAKRLRTGGLQTFSVDMHRVEAIDRNLVRGPGEFSPHNGAVAVRLLAELRRAIAHSELVTVYQPKFDLGTDQIVGLEALVRWPHPESGILEPDDFLPLVRQHGLMRLVTERVLELALDDAARWQRQFAPIPVAINLFAGSLGDETLADFILMALAERDLPPESLIVEITEDLLVDDMTRARALLVKLRNAGVRIALDDFGSGYSALRNLRELPIDELKLDREFIASLLTDRRTSAIVRAVIDLAHALGVTTVAEGVEDAQTARQLQQYGCEMGQGFHYCPPISASEVLNLLTATAARR